MKDLLIHTVRVASGGIRSAVAGRDRAIRHAAAEGCSVDDIAEAASIDATEVERVVAAGGPYGWPGVSGQYGRVS